MWQKEKRIGTEQLRMDKNRRGIKCWIAWLRLDCVWNPYHGWILNMITQLVLIYRNESKVFWNELVSGGLALLNASQDFAVPSHGIMSSPSLLSPLLYCILCNHHRCHR